MAQARGAAGLEKLEKKGMQGGKQRGYLKLYL